MSYPYSIFQQPYIEDMKNRPGKTERPESLLRISGFQAFQRINPNGFCAGSGMLSNESSIKILYDGIGLAVSRRFVHVSKRD